LTLVCSFDQIAPGSLSLVGGKAHNLARLAQAGFPVPPGFCLTIDAYRRHLAANDLSAEIEALLAQPGVSADERAWLAQQAITAASLPSDLRQAVVQAHRALTGDDPLLALAVRSSALAEDAADASFAGQHDTFLDVRGELALLESIKRCWASLWTARALSYRARLRPNDPHAALAVVVQRMVPADCAGVAFTINPLTGSDEIVLEATPGLGERLVAGRVAPDRYRVNRRTWQILEASPLHPGRAVLNPAQIAGLARLAARVEDHFGSPQDIEWACSDGQIYLLQSRPVTAAAAPDFVTADGQVDMAALLRRADESGSEMWTDDNVGEVIPDAVTPLTWSVLEPLGNGAFRAFLRRVGLRRYPAAGLFGRFYGRIYFNQSQFQRLMRRFYPSHLGQIGGGRFRLLGLARAALALTETGLRALALIPRLPRQAERLVKAVPIELARIPEAAALSDRALWAEAERWRQAGQPLMSVHLAVTIFATLLYSLLDKLVVRWGGGAVETAHLVAGLPGLKSAEMGRDLAALADQAAADPALRDELLNNPPSALAARLGKLPGLAAFLARHGHASRHEFELAFPRWRDDAACVLAMVQNHLRATRDGRAAPGPTTQQATRDYALRTMRRRLRPGLRRLLFGWLLRWTQRYSLARENVKYTFVMAHSHLRDLYLALAVRLVARGDLAETDALFYLTRDQIAALLDGQLDRAEAAQAIAHGRAEYQRCRQNRANAPKIVEQWPDGTLRAVRPAGRTARLAASDQATLHGVAASPGRVTGRARVICDAPHAARLERGEVLVAPSTNPAWAPLLLNAAALVTEVGGLLSHGAIVAREYGLPAVLNVEGATQAIRTGQLVAVDGHAGTVSLLDEK